MLDPRLLLHLLRTSTASHLPARTISTLRGPPTGSRLRPASGGVAHRKLAGADDLYTARAANRQPAQAGCGGAGVQDALADDLLKALAEHARE